MIEGFLNVCCDSNGVLSESLYIDFLGGTQNTEEGFSVYQGDTQIMNAGGFNLRKWSTNSEGLDKKIPSEITYTQSNIVKVLQIITGRNSLIISCSTSQN